MIRTALLLVFALILGACNRREDTAPVVAPDAAAPPADQAAKAPAEPAVPTARAVLNPTQGNKAAGELTLRSEGNSVRVSGQLTGLKPNAEHAIHIHEKGDCSAADASSAGGHFNPTNQPHDHPDGQAHHSGDMYNATADDKGNAQIDDRASNATLGDGAPTDVAGKSIVVHEKPDDYKTQPSGNSGKRIACGVIQRR